MIFRNLIEFVTQFTEIRSLTSSKIKQLDFVVSLDVATNNFLWEEIIV